MNHRNVLCCVLANLLFSLTCYGEEPLNHLTLTRLKAEPTKYLDKAFLTVGVLTVSDFYPKDYPKHVYSAFLLSEISGEGKLKGTLSGETAYLFLNRVYGEKLLNTLLGKGKNGEPILCSVLCMLDRSKYTSTDWDELELLGINLWNSEKQTLEPPIVLELTPEKREKVNQLLGYPDGFPVIKWRSRGYRSVDARFVNFQDGMVTLETTSGQTITIPLDSLAAGSQAMAKMYAESLKNRDRR